MKFSREIKIGFFAIVMIVCLYLGINYLKGKDVFSSDKLYHALLDNTNGLQTSAPVLLRGVKIGSVTDIDINSDMPDKVVVTVGIKRDVAIPTDSRLILLSSGLMGEKAIGLALGVSGSYFQRGDIIPSEIESGLLESASLSIEDLVGEAKTVINSLVATSTSLNDILTRNAGGIEGIVSNLNSVTHKLSTSEIDAMLSDLGDFSTMLKNNSGRLDTIIGNFDTVSTSLARADLRGTLDTLGMSISRLNTVFAKISDGDGTAARLLDDPALYDSLTAAAGNLAALLEDLESNPKRYVHFSLFGRRDKASDKK